MDTAMAAKLPLGTAIKMHSPELGEFWLVTDYTKLFRKEITLQHSELLCKFKELFPGAQVTLRHRL